MRNLKIVLLGLALTTGLASVSVANANEDRGDRQARFERMCSNDHASKAAEWSADKLTRVSERLKLTDAQKAAFKDYQDAQTQAREETRTALCANKPDLTSFVGRLTFRQNMLERRAANMKTTTPKLIAFYNSLNGDQKVEFALMREHHRHGRGHWRK